ncbi:hypothetical protein NMY22_g13920 [Coprinellus aureogranulatus]|nr:hypothetical protein NMY22_g13920 [Coprinellus aureogranulatus]
MSLLDVEGTVTPTPSLLENAPLLSKATGVNTNYSAARDAPKKNSPRSFDLDATTSPGQSTPSSPPAVPPTQSRDFAQPTSNDSGAPRPVPQESLLEKVRNKTSLRLVNSGSVARDHLASERTFLAYIRTSLAIASSGVALVQLFSVANSKPSSPENVAANYAKMQWFVRPLGAIAILTGISVLVIGVTRYFLVQSALTKGYFPAARSAIAFISLSLAGLVCATFVFLYWTAFLSSTAVPFFSSPSALNFTWLDNGPLSLTLIDRLPLGVVLCILALTFYSILRYLPCLAFLHDINATVDIPVPGARATGGCDTFESHIPVPRFPSSYEWIRKEVPIREAPMHALHVL